MKGARDAPACLLHSSWIGRLAQVSPVRRVLLERYVPNRDARRVWKVFTTGGEKGKGGVSDLDADLERSPGCDSERVELALARVRRNEIFCRKSARWVTRQNLPIRGPCIRQRRRSRCTGPVQRKKDWRTVYRCFLSVRSEPIEPPRVHLHLQRSPPCRCRY